MAAFRSGEKYVKIKEEHLKERRLLEHGNQQLKAEAFAAHAETIRVRSQWFEVFGDMEKEHKRKLDTARLENKKLEKRALDAERRLADAQDKIRLQRLQNYELATQLEEEKGKNLKLHAQLNRDYENSSIPSSQSAKKKKISNSREKTGRKPGGQPGHKGHRRTRQASTAEPVFLPPPKGVLDDPGFKKTGKTIVKQLVSIHQQMDVAEYHADVYYNPSTGERILADFPDGVIDDVNYDGSIKAFLFLLNNDCCISIDKSRNFLSDLTGGRLNISKGMINNLCKEFAEKTEQERKGMFADILLSPVMHTDCTNARINGKSGYVFICAAPEGASLYFVREKKGHEGVKGTPAEEFRASWCMTTTLLFTAMAQTTRNALPISCAILKTVWITSQTAPGTGRCVPCCRI